MSLFNFFSVVDIWTSFIYSRSSYTVHKSAWAGSGGVKECTADIKTATLLCNLCNLVVESGFLWNYQMTREYDMWLGSNIKELYILPHLYILFHEPIMIFWQEAAISKF